MSDRTFHLKDALREIAGAPRYPALLRGLRRQRGEGADLDVDLSGRVCVVTGGTAGLGLAIARGLARLHATVVIVGRDPARGEAARRAIAAESAPGRVSLELADVASLGAVHALADRIAERHERVDVLVNNAGVSLWERRTSADGLEMTFATNVLGGFVLTHRLLPLLLHAAPARILHMTSIAIYTQRLDVEALLSRDERRYGAALQYANTKRAQVELNALWVRHLSSSRVTSSCVHPGLAATPGVAQNFPLYHRVLGRVLRNPAEGADTALWLAASPSASGRTGELWFDRAPRPEHVVPWTQCARSEAERLWTACATLGGIP